jgi:hypothetical protein
METDAVTLAATLSARVADLDGYIERKAAGIAAPMIEAARRAAAQAVTSAEHENQRQEDLNAELRRRVAGLMGQQEQIAAFRRRVCDVLGWPRAADWLPLAQEIAGRLERQEEDHRD